MEEILEKMTYLSEKCSNGEEFEKQMKELKQKVEDLGCPFLKGFMMAVDLTMDHYESLEEKTYMMTIYTKVCLNNKIFSKPSIM
jgi:hypothetical protein